ncbi:hypothetical protein GCM10009862_30310 [Microbacterium binotii]|uniref:Uncharacterized protein n=1 Tax=Microbacterium binotii TaxID=462710 RepID=A0ABN3PJZ2_9MICO
MSLIARVLPGCFSAVRGADSGPGARVRSVRVCPLGARIRSVRVCPLGARIRVSNVHATRPAHVHK